MKRKVISCLRELFSFTTGASTTGVFGKPLKVLSVFASLISFVWTTSFRFVSDGGGGGGGGGPGEGGHSFGGGLSSYISKEAFFGVCCEFRRGLAFFCDLGRDFRLFLRTDRLDFLFGVS